MSTFFRSAAMTLLSKTLQTLLYKYLSDVDVEGVALPSLYSSSSTEGHSGWGVRLSNVKLREGTKLMDLPGNLRRKRKEKNQKVSDETSGLQKTYSTLSTKEALSSEATADELSAKPSSAEDNASEEPIEASKGWFSGWYRRSSPRSIPEESPAEMDHHITTSSIIAPCFSGARTDEPDTLVGVLSEDKEQALPEPDTSESQRPEPSIETGDTEAQSEEQDEADEDPPVILRLGNGGRIGVLDVRLVGKSIQVLVEDANLTFEIALVKDEEKESSDEKEAASSDAKLPDKKKDPQTVEERILAEIALARVFSAIPNLFLRDIRIRVIVREEEVSVDPESVSDHIGANDTVLDFSIELLSVTDGEDFLSSFRAAAHVDGEHSAREEEDATFAEDDEEEDSGHSLSVSDSHNDFSIRRIRTGRGPEGGLSLRMFKGQDIMNFGKDYSTPMWARHSWVTAADFYTLRLSGLDIETRIFLGERKETIVSTNEFIYDDFNVDSMLFGGVDYIAPGPQPPLPPMVSNGEIIGEEDQPWTIPGATNYVSDSNGIQRCGVGSSFHRVARGLRPAVCQKDHVPCEYCTQCWDAAPGIPRDHELDSSTPMAGLVLHASMRDPLEVNLDRATLEAIGLFVDILKKPSTNVPAEVVPLEAGLAELSLEESCKQALAEESQRSTRSFFSRANSAASVNDDSQRDQAIQQNSRHQHDESQRSNRSFFSRASIASGDTQQDKTTEETIVRQRSDPRNIHCRSTTTYDKNIESSYPSYMQPEKIQVLGLHLSEVRIRMHVLRNDGRADHRLSFCYWDLSAKCLTMDAQQLSAPERPFLDIRLDVGYLTATEFTGIEQKQLISLGIRQREVDFDEITVETLMTREPENKRPPWPSTAAALLDLPPPLETLLYEARERHGLQLRYFMMTEPGNEQRKSWGHANLWIGSAYIDVPFSIRDVISAVISESKSVVQGRNTSPVESLPGVEVVKDYESSTAAIDTRDESRLQYKLRFAGGRVRMEPTIDVHLPLTALTGEKSSLSGISIETILHNAKVKYSKPAPRVVEHGLSLPQLAELPENVRLRVLLFLPDLKPLELALGINAEPNSFLRCRAVNKGIVKFSKRHLKRLAKSVQNRPSQADRPNRRQELLAKVMALDDLQLETLLMHHQRSHLVNSYDKTPRR